MLICGTIFNPIGFSLFIIGTIANLHYLLSIPTYNAALCGKFGAQRKICPTAAPCYASSILTPNFLTRLLLISLSEAILRNASVALYGTPHCLDQFLKKLR